MASVSFAPNLKLDATSLAQAYSRNGRVRVENFLAQDSAEALLTSLRSREDWQQAINSGEKVLQLSRATRAAMTDQQRAALDGAVYDAARTGFQFRYETVRVSDDREVRRASTDVLTRFAEWLSEGAQRDFLRVVTGSDAIDFADAQATAFAPGDFLTGHDDIVVGRNRHAAYVFSLNPIWRIEWGGLLLFHGREESSGLSPSFNTLDIFRVGSMHSVSEVTRSAAYRRYSITGWLRSR